MPTDASSRMCMKRQTTAGTAPRRRRRHSKPPSAWIPRARSSRATTRPTSRSRSPSIRIAVASTAVSTVMRARAMPTSACRRASISRHVWSPSRRRRGCWNRNCATRATGSARSRWAAIPIRTSRSSANCASRARFWRYWPRTNTRSPSSPNPRWWSATSTCSRPWPKKPVRRVRQRHDAGQRPRPPA